MDKNPGENYLLVLAYQFGLLFFVARTNCLQWQLLKIMSWHYDFLYTEPEGNLNL